MSPDGITLAHGIGGPKDLPISLGLTLAGASAALVVSFTVLAVAWRNPRYDAATSGRPAPALLARVVDSTGWRITWPSCGLSTPKSARTSVLLPEPFGPTMVTISPGSIRRLTRSSTFAPP